MKHMIQKMLHKGAGYVLVVAITIALVGMAQCDEAPWAVTKSIVVPEGRSIMIRFDAMSRVQIANPDIADIVIASANDLAIYGKLRGVTTLYIWDSIGLHEYEVNVTGASPAQKMVNELRQALGMGLMYTVAGEKTLVIEGSVDNREQLQRVHSIIAACTGPVKIVDLVTLEGSPIIPAVAAVEALKDILGDGLDYVVMNMNKLIVQGDLADPAAVEQAHKVISAASSDQLEIVDLVQYNDELASPPLREIQEAIGLELRVWQVKGRTVAVDGEVKDQAEYDRLTKILESFVDKANIINLIRVVKPRPEIEVYAQQLQEAFGADIQVKKMGPETLALQGSVPSEEMRKYYEEILDAMEHPYRVVNFLKVIEPDKEQIEVSVLVAEIHRDDMDKYGIGWGQIVTDDEGNMAFIDQPILVLNEGGTESVFPLGSQVEALLEDSYSRILARPSVMVNDGEVATIHVGGEVPIPIAEPGPTGITTISIEYKKYGVSLDIEPIIGEDGKTIKLLVTPEVSSLDWTNAVTISGFVIPALRTRKATTTVNIADGGTLALGGLLQKEDAEVMRKIPVISEIPIIGELFKHRSFISGESELVIFVTPRIGSDKVHGPGYVNPAEEELRQIQTIAH